MLKLITEHVELKSNFKNDYSRVTVTFRECWKPTITMSPAAPEEKVQPFVLPAPNKGPLILPCCTDQKETLLPTFTVD